MLTSYNISSAEAIIDPYGKWVVVNSDGVADNTKRFEIYNTRHRNDVGSAMTMFVGATRENGAEEPIAGYFGEP